MEQFGWNDRIEKPIRVVYRRKGEMQNYEFRGGVAIIGTDKKTLTWISRDELPVKSGTLNLTNAPVITIGGKRKFQFDKVLDFLKNNPSFEGAFLLFPGTGNYDLGEGMLLVTSKRVLEGERFSGGHVEITLANHRWLPDGRYVADKVKMLHGKILEVIEKEIEQSPGPEKIAEILARSYYSVKIPLASACKTVIEEIDHLSKRRALATGQYDRNPYKPLYEYLLRRFREMGIQYLRDIPENFTISTEEVVPELASRRETLDIIEIPGVGAKRVKGEIPPFGTIIISTPFVELTIEEFQKLTSWPFENICPVITDFGDPKSQLTSWLQNAIKQPPEKRMAALRECFSQYYREKQRVNIPKNKVFTSYKELPTEPPKPIVWGHDPFTDEDLVAYPVLQCSRPDGVKKYDYEKYLWKLWWSGDRIYADLATYNALQTLEKIKKEETQSREGNIGRINLPRGESKKA